MELRVIIIRICLSLIRNIIDLGLLQAFDTHRQVRHYHTSGTLNKNLDTSDTNISYLNAEILKELYKDRLAPVKPFSEKFLATLSNILDNKERLDFLKEWGDRGGIYIFQYKHDPLVFYIGRTVKFSNRLRSHIKHRKTDKFHVFANVVGWDNFIVGIVEICGSEEQGIRENYYLQKYLPLLNSTFLSKYSETAIFQTLRNILLSKKPEAGSSGGQAAGVDTANAKGRTLKVAVWVYKLCATHINKSFVKYVSISKACKGSGPSRETIQMYLDTNVPIKGLLFYTRPLEDFDTAFNLAIRAYSELNIDGNMAKKVWVYHIVNGTVVLVNNQPFPSREQVAKFFNTYTNAVLYYIDSWKSKGLNGYYLYSNPLDDLNLIRLLEFSKENSIKPKVLVWAYDAHTLELINSAPFPSMQKCAEYLKSDYGSIAKHLDTKLAILRNGMLVYLFSSEITIELKKELLVKLEKTSYIITKIWVYKKEDSKYILFGDNQPFKSKLQASKSIGVATKTITRYLDTHECYQELFFFSYPVDTQ